MQNSSFVHSIGNDGPLPLVYFVIGLVQGFLSLGMMLNLCCCRQWIWDGDFGMSENGEPTIEI